MTRAEIYANSVEYDEWADDFEERAKAARAKAKRLRWIEAPTWANCIVSPSQSALHGLHYREVMIAENPQYAMPVSPGSPQSEDDWRWANRTNTGWFLFTERGDVRSAAEAGDWIIEERRHVDV